MTQPKVSLADVLKGAENYPPMRCARPPERNILVIDIESTTVPIAEFIRETAKQRIELFQSKTYEKESLLLEGFFDELMIRDKEFPIDNNNKEKDVDKPQVLIVE